MKGEVTPEAAREEVSRYWKHKTTQQPMSDKTIRLLVQRVMKDGDMTKFEACGFVAGMFENCIGLYILSIVDQ